MDAPARRPPRSGARREWQDARVLEVRRETARASTYRLGLPRWEPHVPGQHYVVRLVAPDGYRAERSYSVASPPSDEGVIELTVERLADGEVSAYLHDGIAPGDELTVRGPFGGWFVWRGDTPAVLVGGGSGVVPLMAMHRHWRATGRRAPLRMAVAARSPEELLYRSEYGDETLLAFSRAVPEGSPRPRGRLTAADLEPLLLPGATHYVCGSTPFAGHAEELLLGLGVPADAIRVERFGGG
ncbi:oxidoreductase [Vallicoccus soli]|uniref:Oxidoreductase n=1 Tax=Vallicoccus soli TaxID=2339232 RepID=A0A3A3Z1Z4_9ACTN|nr:oxidoreductase [Vallicoccus soli]